MSERNQGKLDHICGIHSTFAILDQSPDRVRKVVFAKNFHGKRLQELRNLARDHGIRIEVAPKTTLDRLSAGDKHQGVVALCQHIKPRAEAEFEDRFSSWQKPLIMVCEGIQDPRNLGSCLRAADAAGVDAVLVAKNRCAPLTHTVHRTSAGALEALFIVEVINVARRLDWLQKENVTVIGTDEQSDTLYSEIEYDDAIAIVVGGEEKGLRRLTREKCDRIVSIPMMGRTPSLNVSVATGILLFEAQRQRGFKAER